MKHYLLFVCALVLLSAIGTGCASQIVPGPAPAPKIGEVRQTSHVDGEGVFGSILVSGVPFTFPARWWGEADVTWVVDALGPRVYFDGDADFILEPIEPGDTATLDRLQREGRLTIRKYWRPVTFDPYGSVTRAHAAAASH